MRSYSTLIFLTVRNYGACGVADLQNNFIRAELRRVRKITRRRTRSWREVKPSPGVKPVGVFDHAAMLNDRNPNKAAPATSGTGALQLF
jgi:hypothetical protein